MIKNRRIVHGNFTTLPTGADVLSQNVTNAVTESAVSLQSGKTPVSSAECVREARIFCQENQK